MRVSWIGAGLLCLLAAGSAKASGDYSCTQEWRLGGEPSASRWSARDCADRPLLWPGNDTRSNLFLLLRGGQGLSIRPGGYSAASWEDRSFGHSFYSWYGLGTTYGLNLDSEGSGGGSYCDSLERSAPGFAAALVGSRGLPVAERDALGKARETIGSACTGKEAGSGWPSVSSKAGKAFLAYLQAADAFYAGQWDSARKGFAKLAGAVEPWVAETATYMAIRVELNAAQQAAFDDYGDFRGSSATDRAAVARAGAAIGAYLKRFPQGRYAASAGGLRRRVAWLAGDQAALAREYEAALANMSPDGTGAAELIQEIDNKLLWADGARAAITSPLLLATMDMARMRRPDGDGRPLSADELAAHRAFFARSPELYSVLAATRALYVDRDARAVLALIPAQAPEPGMSPLAYSLQGLRGMALAQLRDPGEEAHWRALIAAASAPYTGEFAQLGLALLWQRSGRLGDVFAPGSPLTDQTIRQILLARLAGPDLLRAAIADRVNDRRTRDLALFALLHKDLAMGHFADFARDAALLPRDASTEGYPAWLLDGETVPTGLFASGKWQEAYACPAIARTAQALAARPGDSHALLCLGDFWRINGFDRMSDLDAFSEPDRLGGGKSLFGGRPLTRASLYATVLADPRAGREERAYALYRSVMCYAPSGSNDCGGEDVAVETRKGWFQQLKQRYSGSVWAEKLRYYW